MTYTTVSGDTYQTIAEKVYQPQTSSTSDGWSAIETAFTTAFPAVFNSYDTIFTSSTPLPVGYTIEVPNDPRGLPFLSATPVPTNTTSLTNFNSLFIGGFVVLALIGVAFFLNSKKE